MGWDLKLRHLHSPPSTPISNLWVGILGPGMAGPDSFHVETYVITPVWAWPATGHRKVTYLPHGNVQNLVESNPGSRLTLRAGKVNNTKWIFRAQAQNPEGCPHSAVLYSSFQFQDPWLWFSLFRLIRCNKSEERPTRAAITANSLTQRRKKTKADRRVQRGAFSEGASCLQPLTGPWRYPCMMAQYNN